MKNIAKMFMAALVITGFASCEDEQDLVYVNPPASFNILTPQNGESVVLNPDNQSNPALTLAWESANYGTPTEITYTVQVAKNGEEGAWDNPVNVTVTSNTFASIDVATLNQATDDAGLFPFIESGLDVRIKADVQGAEARYSNVITYLVTPFSTDLPKLAVVGNHQGWSPTAADVPLLASKAFGNQEYEGYVWLDGEFKILAPNAQGQFNWPNQGGGIEYGIDGSDATKVAEGGANLNAPVAGYYYVKVNTETKAFSIMLTKWGILGSATQPVTGADGWTNDYDLTYDSTTRKWTGTLALVGGQEIKFRANDDWGLNYGDDPAVGDPNSLEQGAANMMVSASGNYTVTLDLSNPRMYSYSLQQN